MEYEKISKKFFNAKPILFLDDGKLYSVGKDEAFIILNIIDDKDSPEIETLDVTVQSRVFSLLIKELMIPSLSKIEAIVHNIEFTTIPYEVDYNPNLVIINKQPVSGMAGYASIKEGKLHIDFIRVNSHPLLKAMAFYISSFFETVFSNPAIITQDDQNVYFDYQNALRNRDIREIARAKINEKLSGRAS